MSISLTLTLNYDESWSSLANKLLEQTSRELNKPSKGALRNLRITKTTFEKRRCFEQVTRLSCSQCQCFVGFIFYIRLRFVSTVETLSKQIEMDGRALIFIVKIRIEWHGYGHAVSIEMWQIRFIISFLLSHIPYYCVITQYSLLLHNTVWQRSLVVIGWECF